MKRKGPAVPRYIVESTWVDKDHGAGGVTCRYFDSMELAMQYRRTLKPSDKVRIFSTKFKLLYYRAGKECYLGEI